MAFFDLKQTLPTVIFEDNAAVVATAKNPGKNHGKLKHVSTRVKFVQEHVLEMKTVNVVFQGTDQMVADLMTKALPIPKHEMFTADALGHVQLGARSIQLDG